MSVRSARVESGIVFRGARGTQVRGSIVHFAPDSLMFEVYSPQSEIEPGETIREMILYQSGRPVLSGGATVQSVLATGVMWIVTATPLAPWKQIPQLAPAESYPTAEFLLPLSSEQETLLPEYRLSVAAIRSFFIELREFAAPIDLAFGTQAPDGRETPPEAMIEAVFRVVQPRMKALFDRFERAALQVPPDRVLAHRAFAQRELHPFMLCAPLVHRSFTKPLGYAGDHDMVSMLLRNRMEGPSTYAKLVNAYFLRMDVADGHRNRIDRLTDILTQETQRVWSDGRPLRVMNLGCGPAEEVCRFIRRSPLADSCQFTLLDFNDFALDYARARIREAAAESGRAPQVRFVCRSVIDLVKSGARARQEPDEPRYDLVYCAGLFDYLTDRVCARLLELLAGWLTPGGTLLVTNVHPRHSAHATLDDLAEWHLILRTEQELLALARLSEVAVSVETEPAGVNVFLKVRKPEARNGRILATERCRAVG